MDLELVTPECRVDPHGFQQARGARAACIATHASVDARRAAIAQMRTIPLGLGEIKGSRLPVFEVDPMWAAPIHMTRRGTE